MWSTSFHRGVEAEPPVSTPLYDDAPPPALSADGTRIAFERAGDGPALILVEPAGHYRGLSALAGLVPLLSDRYTVYTYDRRGRGESTDTLPYAPAREVEDLGALLDHTGGSAHLYGFSSGALLAMHAAAAGLPVGRLALLEPPLPDEGLGRIRSRASWPRSSPSAVGTTPWRASCTAAAFLTRSSPA